MAGVVLGGQVIRIGDAARREQRLLEPLAVGEHALLMTARKEVAGLAGVGQQIVVPALVTIDASEAMMEITAGQEALEHLCFDGAGNEAGYDAESS